MTKIFVAEFLCGGGMFDTPLDRIPKSLLGEGTAMWRALVNDVSAWATVVTPIDPRMNLVHDEIAEFIAMPLQSLPWQDWIDGATDCDAAMIVAPEMDNLLIKAVTRLRTGGVPVLSVGNAALRLTCDKWQTAKWMHRAGIAHPETWALDPDTLQPICSRPPPSLTELESDGFFVKPRDGCGAMEIRHYQDLEPALESMLPHEITQRRIVGRPGSVSVVACHADHACTFLPAVWQSIESVSASNSDSCIRYQGGCGPVDHEFQMRAQAIATRAMESMPGKPSGFIGIDWIAGTDPNHDCLIEINPRLTTSYVGVRQMLTENVTERLWRPLSQPLELKADRESVRWDTANL